MGYKSRGNYRNIWEHERVRLFCPHCCEYAVNAVRSSAENWVCQRCGNYCIETRPKDKSDVQ